MEELEKNVVEMKENQRQTMETLQNILNTKYFRNFRDEY